MTGGVDAERMDSICLSTGSSVSCFLFGTKVLHCRCSHDFIRLPYAIPMMQGSRNSMANRESMTMNVLQSTCLSGVIIKASSNDTTNHEAVSTDRSLENHLSMIMSYKRKNSTSRPIHPDMDRAENCDLARAEVLAHYAEREQFGRSQKTNPAVADSKWNATAATTPNTVAATTVSGSSIMRKLSDNRFIAHIYQSLKMSLTRLTAPSFFRSNIPCHELKRSSIVTSLWTMLWCLPSPTP